MIQSGCTGKPASNCTRSNVSHSASVLNISRCRCRVFFLLIFICTLYGVRDFLFPKYSVVCKTTLYLVYRFQQVSYGKTVAAIIALPLLHHFRYCCFCHTELLFTGTVVVYVPMPPAIHLACKSPSNALCIKILEVIVR